ncbi:MAG: hypothetical protein F6J98_45975 [Moorea sp. SIO4G2]|nr:hypothetical protein [Moorena sp. SIO4G2]
MTKTDSRFDSKINILIKIYESLKTLHNSLPKNGYDKLKNNINKAQTNINNAVKNLNDYYDELRNVYQAPPPPDEKDIV